MKSKSQRIQSLESEPDSTLSDWKTEIECILKVKYHVVNYKDEFSHGELYNINMDVES